MSYVEHAYWGRTFDVLIKKYYIPLMGRLPWLKGRWSGSIVNERRRWRKVFSERWTLQSNPAGRFEGALLVAYENYDSFVRSGVLYLTTIKKILCGGSPLLLDFRRCLVLRAAWSSGLAFLVFRSFASFFKLGIC